MMAINVEQRLQFLLLNHVFLLVIDYALGSFKLSTSRCYKPINIQTQGCQFYMVEQKILHSELS